MKVRWYWTKEGDKFAGRKDGRAAEGVGFALIPHSWAALTHYQPVSLRMPVAEFLTQMRPLSVVVVYSPTNQSTVEDKKQFYSDLDGVVSRTSGLAMVILMQLLERVY